ncbi:RsiV family protein [Candidatus Clostridium stratigraminis]|uniref:RsiV family protein n=1 Tax=Candidatus Clostridium stratigraminis TaxID=3381661 RepID=A0ABW8T3Y3_9CLOT
MNKDLFELKKEYLEIPIPKELDFIVKGALKKAGVKKNNTLRRISITAASIAVLIAALTIGVNSSPVFARNLAKVPIVGNIVRIIAFKEYVVDEGNYNAKIKTPAIQGLKNKDLESSLNEKYLAENKKLYEEFTKEIEELKGKSEAHLGVDSGYIVKTDNENILSVGRYVVNTAASSSTTMKYDTIDKQREVLITLPSLFKDNSYVKTISNYIKTQMIEQMKADDSKTYWVHIDGKEDVFPVFNEIAENQSFYINQEGKLVISFDKYEVGPGVMGIVEFTIPTELIKNTLVGDEYIK